MTYNLVMYDGYGDWVVLLINASYKECLKMMESIENTKMKSRAWHKLEIVQYTEW